MKQVTVEVRPALVRDPQLRVRDLPEKEIAHAHFAGGSDQKVGLGHPGRIKRPGDCRLIYVSWFELSFAHASSETANRVDNFSAGAVIDRQAENHAGVVFRQANVLVYFVEDACRQALAPSDGLEANI